jgi:hypothetical protein
MYLVYLDEKKREEEEEEETERTQVTYAVSSSAVSFFL